jgi:hypothetical protein
MRFIGLASTSVKMVRFASAGRSRTDTGQKPAALGG